MDSFVVTEWEKSNGRSGGWIAVEKLKFVSEIPKALRKQRDRIKKISYRSRKLNRQRRK